MAKHILLKVYVHRDLANRLHILARIISGTSPQLTSRIREVSARININKPLSTDGVRSTGSIYLIETSIKVHILIIELMPSGHRI
jgi:hypothetical protein